MKPNILLILLFFSSTLLQGQSSNNTAKPDLSKFTSEQLTACFTNKSICGTDDEIQIAGELSTRIRQFSTGQLLACFAEWKICGADSYSLTAEVVRRGHREKLMLRYWNEPNSAIQAGILQALYDFHSPEVTAFMKKVLAIQKGPDEELYWSANYLAKQCDPAALHWLSDRKERSQSCMQYTGTVALFGKCQYRPAIPYLIRYSLNDACLNIVDAAEVDLRAMYSHSPKEFNSIENMQKYYCGRAKQEGLDVHCSSK
jgi:hypothetical protein